MRGQARLGDLCWPQDGGVVTEGCQQGTLCQPWSIGGVRLDLIQEFCVKLRSRSAARSKLDPTLSSNRKFQTKKLFVSPLRFTGVLSRFIQKNHILNKMGSEGLTIALNEVNRA